MSSRPHSITLLDCSMDYLHHFVGRGAEGFRWSNELRSPAGAMPSPGQEPGQCHRWDLTSPSSGRTANTWIWTDLRAMNPGKSCASRDTRPSWLAWEGQLRGVSPDSKAYCIFIPRRKRCWKAGTSPSWKPHLQPAACYGAAKHLRKTSSTTLQSSTL